MLINDPVLAGLSSIAFACLLFSIPKDKWFGNGHRSWNKGATNKPYKVATKMYMALGVCHYLRGANRLAIKDQLDKLTN